MLPKYILKGTVPVSDTYPIQILTRFVCSAYLIRQMAYLIIYISLTCKFSQDMSLIRVSAPWNGAIKRPHAVSWEECAKSRAKQSLSYKGSERSKAPQISMVGLSKQYLISYPVKTLQYNTAYISIVLCMIACDNNALWAVGQLLKRNNMGLSKQRTNITKNL